MSDNFKIEVEGKEWEVNDPYHLASRMDIMKALEIVKERVQKYPFESSVFEKSSLLVVGADGGIITCKVTSHKPTTKPFFFMLNDKYEPRNQFHLATWMYERNH